MLEPEIEQSKAVIAQGSKSFAFASRLFDRERQEAAALLYRWCRACDDAIDQAKDPAEAESRLTELFVLTRQAFSPQAAELRDPVFVSLAYVARKYSIPERYAVDLIEGMAMDVRGERYERLEDLLRYCYHVAGTVGLMMAHIMGVSDRNALPHALALGQSMQLINISRDILEDAAMGRVYLPLGWLKEAGIPEEEVADPSQKARLAALMPRLLGHAEALARQGDAGLPYLSFRAALAIAAAREIYSEIGRLVLRRGARAWDQRAIVSKPRKLWLALKGVAKLLWQSPRRVSSPWAPVDLSGQAFSFNDQS